MSERSAPTTPRYAQIFLTKSEEKDGTYWTAESAGLARPIHCRGPQARERALIRAILELVTVEKIVVEYCGEVHSALLGAFDIQEVG